MARRKKQPTAQPFLLTIPVVAIQLGVCRATVYNLMYRKACRQFSLEVCGEYIPTRYGIGSSCASNKARRRLL